MRRTAHTNRGEYQIERYFRFCFSCSYATTTAEVDSCCCFHSPVQAVARVFCDFIFFHFRFHRIGSRSTWAVISSEACKCLLKSDTLRCCARWVKEIFATRTLNSEASMSTEPSIYKYVSGKLEQPVAQERKKKALHMKKENMNRVWHMVMVMDGITLYATICRVVKWKFRLILLRKLEVCWVCMNSCSEWKWNERSTHLYLSKIEVIFSIQQRPAPYSHFCFDVIYFIE